MEIDTHIVNETTIAEIISEAVFIKTAEHVLDLIGNLYYQGIDKMIVHEKSITPDFFDLENGIAGEILQKFSNYRIRLAIVGDFTKYPGKSITQFIYESNKNRQVNFVDSTTTALTVLSHK